jgi:hypothetical protein
MTNADLLQNGIALLIVAVVVTMFVRLRQLQQRQAQLRRRKERLNGGIALPGPRCEWWWRRPAPRYTRRWLAWETDDDPAARR